MVPGQDAAPDGPAQPGPRPAGTCPRLRPLP